MVVYRCEDSMEGIFTAVYNAYADHCVIEDTRVSLTDEVFLFAEYRTVVTDGEKAFKVGRTIRERFGEGDFFAICMALSSHHEEKANAVYHVIAMGLKQKKTKGHLLDNLANNDVNLVFKLAKNATREHQHLQGFVRFEEKEGGILYARINPKNRLLSFLMPHFADRLPIENFVIYDDTHKCFGVHPAKGEWYLVTAEENSELLEWCDSDEERGYQDLFRYFCKRVTITERTNPKLQMNMLPLRFRPNMTEFK